MRRDSEGMVKRLAARRRGAAAARLHGTASQSDGAAAHTQVGATE